jgi:hypothetical protein
MVFSSSRVLPHLTVAGPEHSNISMIPSSGNFNAQRPWDEHERKRLAGFRTLEENHRWTLSLHLIFMLRSWYIVTRARSTILTPQFHRAIQVLYKPPATPKTKARTTPAKTPNEGGSGQMGGGYGGNIYKVVGGWAYYIGVAMMHGASQSWMPPSGPLAELPFIVLGGRGPLPE